MGSNSCTKLKLNQTTELTEIKIFSDYHALKYRLKNQVKNIQLKIYISSNTNLVFHKYKKINISQKYIRPLSSRKEPNKYILTYKDHHQFPENHSVLYLSYPPEVMII